MIQESTALIKVDPRADVEVLRFLAESNQLRDFAEARIITTNDDLKPATDDLAIISKVKKAMEAKRKDYLQPFQEHVKEVNEAYKILMTPVEQADKITRDKMTAFINEQNRKRQAAEAIEAEKLALAKREAELKGGEITVDLTPIEKPIVAPQRTTTDMGSAGLKDHWVFEVTDFALLPDDYKMVDAVKLGKVVRAGLHIIPGVLIENKPSLAVTTR